MNDDKSTKRLSNAGYTSRWIRDAYTGLHDVVRRSAPNYLTLLTGDTARLGLQVVYFLTLVNIFTLAEMGVFSTVMAVGLILGSISGLGYMQLAYHTAAQKSRLLGAYLGATYSAILVCWPVGLLVSTIIYYALFQGRIGLVSYYEIMTVELLIWRVNEAIHAANHGLGHFMRSVLGNVLATVARAMAALGFLFAGDGSLETWAHIYLFSNAAAMLLVIWLYHPNCRLRFSPAVIVGRFRDGIYICLGNFIATVQAEIDKIIVIGFVGEAAAGMYTISMRILQLIAVPVGSFLRLYSRQIIHENNRTNLIRRNLPIEAALFVLSTVGFAAMIGVLWQWPTMLGSNVAAAMAMFGAMWLVPAFSNLLQFHSELYFSYGYQLERAVAFFSINVFKALALIGVVMVFPDVEHWGWALNVIFGVMYGLSVILVYAILTDRVFLDTKRKLNTQRKAAAIAREA